MERSLIKLSYKYIIGAHAETNFGKDVFHESYNEFLMQVQAYDREQLYSTWEEVLAANHYKIGFAIGLFVRNLRQRIPGLTDNQGNPIAFAGHQFEIITSDIKNKAAHKVAIVFTTDTLTLLGTAGDHLLLSTGDQSDNIRQKYVPTFLLKLQPQLSISAYALQVVPQ